MLNNLLFVYRGKAREKVADPHNLEERFYKWGVRPEWLTIHRIINHRTNRGKTWYLIKWRDLPYDDCTWEDTETGIVDMEKYIDEYHVMRKVFSGQLTNDNKPTPKDKKKKARRDQKQDIPPELAKKLPPEKVTIDVSLFSDFYF